MLLFLCVRPIATESHPYIVYKEQSNIISFGYICQVDIHKHFMVEMSA